MNAPLPEHIRRAIETVTLDDKYALDRGRAFMSGVQALVRLPILQRTRDALVGLNTAGFVSGYRGSPLGGYDQALWAARKHLEKNHVVFKPGVNEELGATAVWGTQQLDLHPQEKKYDGVFGIWYGKGPGVDRCIDVFKHANMAGTAQHGGVIAIAGDDHISKSSTAAHQSDHVFKAVGFPVFFPTTVQDILDMGLHAFALSRYSGLWSGMKTIQEIVESGATVDVSPDRVKILMPEDFEMPAGGLHIRWPDPPLEQEARMMDHKWYAALAYIRANKLNYNVIETNQDRLGLIASGKAYNDTRQALFDLGLDDDTCRRLGIRLHKVNVVWPLEANITREFATGLKEILVIEEKRQVIEYQIKEQLYNWRSDVRPHVLGKFDDDEQSGGEWGLPNPSKNWLLRPQADLTPAIIARAITQRLKKLGVDADVAARLDARMAVIEAKDRALTDEIKVAGGADRVPWFCSGCPHNTSTRVPEGSRAVAGIGCHYMVSWMPGRNTSTFTQMGGEGVPWVGQSAFSKAKHIFCNLGDGTYFHSGILAIRQSIAAGVNITYKILYNDAVAMTGGQQVGERPEGHSVLQIMNSVISEGVAKFCIVTDSPEKYTGVALPAGVQVHHRDQLDAIQREFREIEGVSAILYDQTCATEKRRRRKRGKMAVSEKRVVINELVCEGCGDCGVQSNCLSIEPLETDFGRKRTINQNSCNQDLSCVKGFCPSFVTVEGGQLKKSKGKKASPFDNALLGEMPHPTLPTCETAWGIVVAGVGGTGVITIGQLLGMAAHLEGKGVVTQDAAGLAQKGGSTWSHIQIANAQEAIHCTKVGTAEADLIIGCDGIVAANKATLQTMRPGRTFVALNTHTSPTASFVLQPDWQHPGSACEQALENAVGKDLLGKFDAEEVAVKLLGDSIYTNPIMMGYAWQMGRIPLSFAAIQRAIELNAVQVDNNKAAFEWGRRCAADYAKVKSLFAAEAVVQLIKRPSLDEMVAQRVEFLTGYQNAAYAAQYKAVVDQVRAAEEKLGSKALSEAVAKYLFKLMAYKDEYEVARLHTDPSFTAKVAAQFEGDYKLVHHLAPPLLAQKNDKGELMKKPFGAWVRPAFRVLASLKGLRGTALDVFGHTEERKMERGLIQRYRQTVDALLASLTAERLPQALELARLPEDIRGYGHVKERHVQAVLPKWERLMAQWNA
ncbi:indolepyruvate ferredoxin oxidoreductase family protein [Inhella gelatinilytica]|uniref:Indolepyruvate ferredoxin oxidoreductase family protein n=1 Tax=Inhella gelatinilytica TaxID=2795030 RepID=A0A931NFI3_9BURK|nr:indolepyruvate ferredoxin oxidoreductase family protein [Inhella gelatinilytica]MBH9553581.1 indolepyruvate ferredoxin oxidoreductase family protein [Inhella gelatinilytica]